MHRWLEEDMRLIVVSRNLAYALFVFYGDNVQLKVIISQSAKRMQDFIALAKRMQAKAMKSNRDFK